MKRRDVITEEILQAAFAALDTLIATPVPPQQRTYSRKEAFLKLRAKAKEALAAGHSLETVLADLKGLGLGLTVSTARQYMKPGRKASGKKANARPNPRETRRAHHSAQSVARREDKNDETRKGTFTVVEDDKEI